MSEGSVQIINKPAGSPRKSGAVAVLPLADELIERFLSAQDVRDTTRAVYRKSLHIFYSWVFSQGLSPSTLNGSDIIRFKEELLRESNRHSVRTVGLYITAVRRFYEWAESQKLYPDIAKNVKIPHSKEHYVKQHLSVEQCESLLGLFRDIVEKNASTPVNGFPKGNIDALRNYAMITLMIKTGLRTIEVSRLNVGDLEWKAGKRILKVWGKGRDTADDFVPVTDGAWKPLKEYLELRGPVRASEPLFVCDGPGSNGRRMSPRRIQAICKEGLRAIGLDSHAYSAHSLRHTTAVLILRGGGTMYDVKHLLRHRRSETSEIYVKSIEEEERLMHSPEAVLDRIIQTA